MKRALILGTLLAIIALPFALRPTRVSPTTSTSASLADTLVIISPHNEAIRTEFGQAFARWYQAQTGRTVTMDWRVIGGTSEIARFLEGEYNASFQNLWTRQLGQPWGNDVAAAFANAKLAADATPLAKKARAAFLASEVSCGIDLFFGGGSFDFIRQAQAGRLVDSGILRLHPDWFGGAGGVPQAFAGEEFWDKEGRWVGAALSAFGIVFNRDEIARRGLTEPAHWADLADPRYAGGIALADPTKSSSIAKAFENLIQEQMQAALDTAGGDKAAEPRAVADGWRDGLRLLQRIAANARYFTDSSQKVPIDVAAGDCAAGMCIDYYGRQQAEAVLRRGESNRVGYVSPVGGTVASADPIALLRGAPHRAVAVKFIEFALSPEGQKLWNLKPGTPGGPTHYALRRLPVRADFYTAADLAPLRSDPTEQPYASGSRLVYRSAWTGGLFKEMSFIVRVMCLDAHDELRAAWTALNAPGVSPAARAAALAVLQDVAAVDYAAAGGRIKTALAAKDKTEEIRLASELGGRFRTQYQRAAELARLGRQ
jgi:iron(III) transport system substrate-binding protein